MTGSGQPTARRVASSSARISTVPMATSAAERIADPEGELVEDPRHVEARGDGREGERPVGERDAARAVPGRGQELLLPPLRRGEDQEDQPEHEGEWMPRWVVSRRSPNPAV